MATEGKTSDTSGTDAREHMAGSEENSHHETRSSNASAEDENIQPLTKSIQKSARTLKQGLEREGRRLVNDAADSAASAATDKKDVAANYLRTVGDAIHTSCDVLDDQGYRGSSKLVRYVADEIDHLAGVLEDREPRALVREAKNYARSHPAVFLGAALLVGFGLVRLLKTDDDFQDAEADADFDDEDDDYSYADDGREPNTYQNQQV